MLDFSNIINIFHKMQKTGNKKKTEPAKIKPITDDFEGS